MNPELRNVHQHMLGLGLGALAHANWHANYSSSESQHWPELSVLQAAHAAELLIKARIAEQHPLLIFDQLPRSTQTGDAPLSLRHLVERGKTIQFSDLPERLWATTGQKLPSVELFDAFGRLRNVIQHFVSPEGRDLSRETIEFIYGVIDPFINASWGYCAVDHNEDTEPYTYLLEGLIQRKVLFCVSTEAASSFDYNQYGWSETAGGYEGEMARRFAEALSDNST